MTIPEFRRIIYDYYSRNRRPMAWRNTRDPYRILVSEIMLQQTQVPRVKEKYRQFLAAFPTLRSLAAAPLSRILEVWQGMGYNRRALYLKRLAETVIREHGGKIPCDREMLQRLPGLGAATSASVCAFAFNQPYPFIETNIRSVFIHYFFEGRRDVKDREIFPLVEQALDREDPRNWYYALMDYGVYLKTTLPNPSRRGQGYKKQPPLEGSVRQLRARIIAHLLRAKRCTREELALLSDDPARFKAAFDGLTRDRLITVTPGGRCGVSS